MAEDYRHSLVPLIIEAVGFKIRWVDSANADLMIVGPFVKHKPKEFRWLPKPLRPIASSFARRMQSQNRPLTLFQTGENIRHNYVPCDFSLSFDLAVNSKNHYRLPYWMESVDWSHEGVSGNTNPRYGRLLDLGKMQQPLGKLPPTRPNRAAFFTSHFLEPRETLYKAVKAVIEVDGFGPYFDKSIRSHHRSGINKFDVLQGYRFNLCPENSLYPGYVTEKIPEAYMAGTIPITWADTNLICDFNPAAMINLHPETWSGYGSLRSLSGDVTLLEKYLDEPLLLAQPSIEDLKGFLKEVLDQATS